MQITLFHLLSFAFALFAIGLVGVLIRREVIVILMSLELMLNAGNLVLVAFNRFHPENMTGHVFAILIITIAAVEAVVGLALVIALYRLKEEASTDKIEEMKG